MIISIVRNSVYHDSRVKKISNYLRDNLNHECIILGIEDGRALPEELDSSIVLLDLKTKYLPKKLPFQLLKYIECWFKIFVFIKKQRNVTTVISNDLSPLLICVVAKMIFKVHLVYDAHELETETHQLIDKPFLKLVYKKLEKNLIKHVDKQIVVSESIKKWYESEYNVNNIKLIRNFPDNKIFKNININCESKNPMNFLFVGALREGKGVDRILDSISKSNNNLKIRIVGSGDLYPSLSEWYRNCKNVEMIGHIPEEKIIDFCSDMSVGIVSTEETCLSRKFSLPNKFFQYIAMGLPVIVPNLPEMKNIIDKFNIGWVHDFKDNESIDSLIEIISKEYVEKCNAIVMFNDENYWDIEADVMHEIFKY